MATFPDRLMEALQASGKTAAEVAREINITEPAMSRYKNGRFVPKAETMDKLAKCLNVSAEWLAGKDAPMARDTERYKILDSQEAEILTTYRHLSASGKEFFAAFAMFLSENSDNLGL